MTAWLELGASYFQNQDDWAAVPAASGPSDWQRVTLTKTGKTDDKNLATVTPATPIQAVPLPAVNITDIKTTDNSLSFTVDKVGVPVVVKTSYFPNWNVSGGNGPYRVAPNQMVVIPTSTHVTLHYGHTKLEYFSYFLSLVGIAGTVLAVAQGPGRLPPPGGAGAGRARSGRRRRGAARPGRPRRPRLPDGVGRRRGARAAATGSGGRRRGVGRLHGVAAARARGHCCRRDRARARGSRAAF